MAASGSRPYSLPRIRIREQGTTVLRICEEAAGLLPTSSQTQEKAGAGLLGFFAFPGPTKEPKTMNITGRSAEEFRRRRRAGPHSRASPSEEALVLAASESSRIRLHRTCGRRGLLDVIAIDLSDRSRREELEHAGRAASGRTSSDQPEMKAALGIPAGEHRESHASRGHHPNFSMHSCGIRAIEYCASSSSADLGDSDFVHCRVRSRREAVGKL